MSEPSLAPFVHHELPTDQSVLAALGKLALRHGQIDNQLRMLIMDLTSVTKTEALDATHRDGSAQLRDRVKRLAKQKLGEGMALVRLQALLERAGRLTGNRNMLVHSVWGTDLFGATAIRTEDHDFRQAPTTEELETIVYQMEVLLDELLTARLEGFLFEALKT